jgi:hypothetical protein
MPAFDIRRALPAAAALLLLACGDDAIAPAAQGPGVQRHYGSAVRVGNGQARAYTTIDAVTNAPLEVGVALDSAALHGLPARDPNNTSGHGDMHEFILNLPTQAPAPYKFVELDWNPAGHGEPYLAPHFDFHFYTISVAERNAIDPSDPQWAAKAGRLPDADYIREGFACPCTLLGMPAAQTAVPRMGQHLIDPRSPEFAGKPFTTTYIVGTWDGRVVFEEPMITRDFILATTDATIPLPAAKRGHSAGWLPGAYRVSYDASSKEYRIALTRLARSE